MRRRTIIAKRGVAMLLVLISLLMASILTTSYLASRDNSTAIGQNAAAGSAARWAAESGLEFGIAVLQTSKDWRGQHTAGRLVTGLALAGGSVNIDLLDLERNQPPSSSTERVKITVTATINGVTQKAVAVAHVPITTDPMIDVDLSEFAVFASQNLDMRGKATIARWPVAPLTSLGERVLIGTRATSASSISLLDDAAAVDATVFHGPGASGLLVSVARGTVPEKVALLDAMPWPAPPASGESPPLLGVSLASSLTQNGGSIITNANTRWNHVELKSSATRSLRGNITVIADGTLSINGNSKLLIDGNVRLIVFGDAVLDQGSIELRSGAKLTMWVQGSSGTAVHLKDGYIGNVRTDNNRDTSGGASYMDTDRLVMYSSPQLLDGVLGTPAWTLDNNSLIKGSIYAPHASVVNITDQSALYGRVASSTVSLTDDAALFYDPALNEKGGFSAVKGPLYYADGRLKEPFRDITSLDTATLQLLADSEDMLVRTVNGLLTPADYEPTTYTSGPTDPTPRPVPVTYRWMAIGETWKAWE